MSEVILVGLLVVVIGYTAEAEIVAVRVRAVA